jgi:hypothetical protein
VAKAGLGIGAAGAVAVLLFVVLGETGLLCGVGPVHAPACMVATFVLFWIVVASPVTGFFGFGFSLFALFDPPPRRMAAAGVALNGVLIALGLVARAA